MFKFIKSESRVVLMLVLVFFAILMWEAKVFMDNLFVQAVDPVGKEVQADVELTDRQTRFDDAVARGEVETLLSDDG